MSIAFDLCMVNLFQFWDFSARARAGIDNGPFAACTLYKQLSAVVLGAEWET